MNFIIYGPIVLLMWLLTCLFWSWASSPNTGIKTRVQAVVVTAVTWLSTCALFGAFND